MAGVISGDTVTLGGTFSDKNVANNKTVTLSSQGTDGGNYTVTGETSTTANITPKAVTVSGITASDKVYDATTAATLNTSGLTLSGLVAGDNVTVSATGTFADKNVANNKTVTLASVDGGLDVGNYTITNQASTTASITAKALTVSGVTANNKIYDGNTNATLNTTGANVVGLISGDTVTLGGTFSDKNVANNKTVTLSSLGTDGGNYTVTGETSTTANITPKALTVSGITAADKVYDATTAATLNTSGLTLNGLVAGDNVTVSATGTFADKNVANNKTVTLASVDGGLDVGNYTITNQASTTVSITAKALTVSGVTANNKIYDGNTNATLNTTGANVAGVISGDTVTLGGTFSDKNVANNKTVTLSSLGTDGGNYTVTGETSTTANITPKALTVSGITAADKVYDATTAATLNTSGLTLSGLVAGDNVTVNATGTFADKNVGQGKAVTLASEDGGLDVGNYTITNQASTTASITAKALTVSGVTANNKIYDGNTNATLNTTGANVAGVISGDTVTLGGTFSDKNVANNKTVTLSSQGTDGGNYTVTGETSTTANITPKALTVSGITASDKVYDATTAATLNTSGLTLSGLVAGDNVTVSATGTFADKNVGQGKTVTLASVDGGLDVGNYTITNQASTTANITPKALVVGGVTANNKIYDGNTTAVLNTSGASLAGVILGDSVTLGGMFSDKNVANNKTVALSSQGTDGGNYTVTGETSTTASITPKTLKVSGITAADKVYDATTTAMLNTSGLTLNGLVAGDNVTVNATGTFADKNVGQGKTVTLASVDGGLDVGNYTITNQASTTASITAKTLIVSGVTADNKIYDGNTNATLNSTDANLGGLIAGDSVSLTGTFSDKNVANNKTVSLYSQGVDSGNYTVTGETSTTANITPKALTVSGITASDKVYDATTAATLNTNGLTLNGLVAGDNVTVSATGAFADKNVGQGKTVTLASVDGGLDVGNYTITNQASTTANITPKALVVGGVTANNKIYDGNTTAVLNTSGASLAGVILGDSVTLGGTFSDKNVANNKTVALSSQGTDGGNYTVTGETSTTANITPKALTVSGITASDKVYDATTAATLNTSGLTLNGLVAGDNVTVNATGTFADKNVGQGKTVTLASVDGGLDVGNYIITNQANTTASITPKALAVSGVTADNKIYDGNTSATLNTTGASLAGLIAGDSVTLGGTFSDKNVANNKTVALSSLGADGGNYTVTSETSTTANITPKALTVSGITASDKVYDATTAAALNTSGLTLSGLVAGDNVTVNATGTFADKNVANNKTVTLASVDGGLDVGNYTITNQASTTASITPKALAVRAEDDSRASTGQPYSGGHGVAYSGFAGGEDASVLNGTLTYSGTSQGAVSTGRYTIIPGGLSSQNYVIEFSNGILTLLPNPAGMDTNGALAGNAGGLSNGLARSLGYGDKTGAGVSVEEVVNGADGEVPVVMVWLPPNFSTKGTSFSFSLPRSIAGSGECGGNTTLTSMDGDSVPKRLDIDARCVVTAGLAPGRALPWHELVVINGKRTILAFSERP